MSSVNEKVVLGSNCHANNFSIRLMDLWREQELVDVILVADDQLFPAHRLILSVLSLSFRKMFKQMPVNQQAYVFMNGVSKETMANLINYMYNGEVELHQESLADFLKKAKSLEIDGISDDIYWQSFGQQQSAQNGFNNSVIQYQTSHINRFQNSDGARNETLPASTFGLSHQSHFGDFAVNGNGTGYNESFYDENNGSYGYDSKSETSTFDDSMSQVFDHENVQWDQTYDDEDEQFSEKKAKKIGAPTAKRTKRNNDLFEYNQPADIRVQNGHENLYHEDKKFTKHLKPNANGAQRWQCTKNRSEKCRAAMSTVEIEGVNMMKVLIGEHTH